MTAINKKMKGANLHLEEKNSCKEQKPGVSEKQEGKEGEFVKYKMMDEVKKPNNSKIPWVSVITLLLFHSSIQNFKENNTFNLSTNFIFYLLKS
jgi:hypothetical protein